MSLARYEDRSGNPCGPRGYEQMDSASDTSRHEPLLSDAELQELFEARLAANRLKYAGLDTLAKGDERGTA